MMVCRDACDTTLDHMYILNHMGREFGAPYQSSSTQICRRSLVVVVVVVSSPINTGGLRAIRRQTLNDATPTEDCSLPLPSAPNNK
jgi:hypothetical protein